MIRTPLDYTNDAFFNKTCGYYIEDDGDWFSKIFTTMDLEDAFEAGQNNPADTTIDKIFSLNKRYLCYCNTQNSLPNPKARNQFIARHWNDDKTI